MGLFGDLSQARSRVLDQRDALANQNQVRNDALRQKMLEMALTMRGQNETNRHNVADEGAASTKAQNDPAQVRIKRIGELTKQGMSLNDALSQARQETGELPPEDKVGDAVKIAQKTKGIPTYGDLHPQANNVYLPSNNKETGETTYTVVPSKGPVNPQATGIIRPAGGANGGGANVQKNKALLDLMEQGYPEMEKLSPRVRPERITAAIKFPTLGNPLLNQDEQNYLANFRNFLAGVLHVESGARLSKDQLMFGLERYAPMLGDTDETKATKLLGAKNTLLARRKEFGGDASHLPGPSAEQGGQTHVGAKKRTAAEILAAHGLQ